MTSTTPTLEPDNVLVLDERPAKPWWSKRRRRVVIVGVVILAAAGASVGLLESSSGTGSASPLEVTTQRVTVTTGTMKQTVSASGTIEPGAQANLDFAVTGTVTAVNVVAGQQVTQGQVLATVDPTALQDQVNADQATLSSDQARLSSDESSSSATASQIDSDQAAVTSASSELTTAKTNLADADLTSTIAGTVASVDLTVGQQVSGSGSSGSGGNSSTSGSSSAFSSANASSSSSSSSSSSNAQIVVVSTNSYTVSSSVDDTEVGELQVGDQAVITPSGSTSEVYGTVSSIGLIASSSSSSVASFPVDIAVTGSPSGLYAGTSASVAITVKQINDALEVPTEALSYSSSGQATVTEVVGGSDVSQAVTTGVSASGETQITSGLSPGDVVLERVVKFNGSGGSVRSLFGGSGTSTRISGGGFPGGGGGFVGGGGGFVGGGGG